MSDFEKRMHSRFLVSGISLSIDADEADAFKIAGSEMKRAGINPARLRFDIYKRSVDARKKSDVRLIYSVAVSCIDGEGISEQMLRRVRRQITVINDSDPIVVKGEQKADYPPLVVGMGPAGLFCALMLAENGPINMSALYFNNQEPILCNNNVSSNFHFLLKHE